MVGMVPPALLRFEKKNQILQMLYEFPSFGRGRKMSYEKTYRKQKLSNIKKYFMKLEFSKSEKAKFSSTTENRIFQLKQNLVAYETKYLP